MFPKSCHWEAVWGSNSHQNSEVFTNCEHLFNESPQIPLKYPLLTKSTIHLELLIFGYGNYLMLFNANVVGVNQNHAKDTELHETDGSEEREPLWSIQRHNWRASCRFLLSNNWRQKLGKGLQNKMISTAKTEERLWNTKFLLIA